jgi:Zn-dependent protease with chaperone function
MKFRYILSGSMAALVLGVLPGLSPAAGAAPSAAPAQLGQAFKRAQQFRDIQMTDDEEIALGEMVSQKIRDRYGVVQDAAVHKYVSLVGTVLAQASSRPNLKWQFIVLDTDGVNALAAPGGFVHITRGALSLMKTEAELACVLGHEITHVTEKHTIHAIQKGKMVQMGTNETLAGNAALLNKLADKAYEVVYAGFGRGEELESDEKGVILANKVGYQPTGLGGFLQTLADRNKDSKEKQGLFASHPEMDERLTKLAKIVKDQKLEATAVLDARFQKNVTYKPVPITAIVAVEKGAAGLAGGGSSKSSDAAKTDEKGKTEEKTEEPKKKRGFGLGKLMSPSSGGEAKSAETTGASAARGVDTERNAKGGTNPKPVAVTVTVAELTAFKKDGKLS